MNDPVIEIFGKTLEKTHIWLLDLMRELGWEDEHKAYTALRSVLHALRDRLSVAEAAHLAAQLPMLVRGCYYEGWNPSGKPVKERHQDEFLAHVKSAFRNSEGIDAEKVARAVFNVLARHISDGEIDDVKNILPEELRRLWR